MATQNIAIPTGENASLILSLATHIFENHGEEIGNAIIGKNFILTYLRSKAQKVESGGLDFAEPVMIAENSNFSHRSHYSQIDAAIQDPTREFKFDPVSLTGTIVINKKHELMNLGKSQIKKLMTTLKMQAETTIENIVNRAMWASSPVANIDPESILSLISSTPTTGTIGGISRSGNTYAQNKVNTTAIASIGAQAGVAALHRMRTTLGGSAKTTPDFAVTTATLFSNLHAYLDDKRQVRADEKMASLGFDTIKVGSATLGYDGDGGTGECPASNFFFLNSRHLFWKVLEGSLFKFEPFSYKDNSLNATSIFYMFHNLTTNLPSSMGRFTAFTA